ncbi:MAG: DUF4142 domain-containing protein [Polyangiaceae bacterium]|jgi:putative membrane protein
MRHRPITSTKMTTIVLLVAAAGCGATAARVRVPSNAGGAGEEARAGQTPALASAGPILANGGADEPDSGAPSAFDEPVPNAQPTTPSARVTWGATEPNSQESGEAENGRSTPPGGSEKAPSIANLDDAQLAAIVQAIHFAEIEQGQLAARKAVLPAVKHFAAQMVFAHETSQGRERVLLDRLQLAPAENAVSNQIKSDAQIEFGNLQSLHGRAFDAAYVIAQVRDHNHAVELIDHVLARVTNAELKSRLEHSRARVAQHLREAEALDQQMATGTTNAQATSSPGTDHSIARTRGSALDAGVSTP